MENWQFGTYSKLTFMCPSGSTLKN